jgi:hypothetical protein
MKEIIRENTDFLVEVPCTCPICGRVTRVPVYFQDYRKWCGQVLAQNAFPYLHPEQRETLISGICPSCQRSLFGEDDEDEVDDYQVAMEDSLAFMGQWW